MMCVICVHCSKKIFGTKKEVSCTRYELFERFVFLCICDLFTCDKKTDWVLHLCSTMTNAPCGHMCGREKR